MLKAPGDGTLGVAKGTDSGTFVFSGRSVGAGSIEVIADGEAVSSVPFEVVPKPG